LIATAACHRRTPYPAAAAADAFANDNGETVIATHEGQEGSRQPPWWTLLGGGKKEVAVVATLSHWQLL
jgi:hypothetical protein